MLCICDYAAVNVIFNAKIVIICGLLPVWVLKSGYQIDYLFYGVRQIA